MSLTANLRSDFSSSAVAAGFLAVVISYAGPLLIFLQAGSAANVSTEMMSSWVWAISMGAAISSIYLCWVTRVPVVTAWSAPGTALLVTLFPEMSINEAVACYITTALLLFVIGLTGSFDRLVRHIPRGVAAGMMAGILFQFGSNVFKSVATMPGLAMAMIGAYLIFKRLTPRYVIMWVLLISVLLSMQWGLISLHAVPLEITRPIFIVPEWTWQSTFGFALPLLLVSLSGQYLPGMALLRLSGFEVGAKKIICTTSVCSLGVACFGGITTVLAAITATLCTGKDAHANPDKRYVAGIANGVFYLLGALFAGAIVTMFTGLPQELIAVLAGLALLGAITSNLHTALQDEEHREAAVMTFLAVASGMSFAGIGSAFWGVVIGMLTYAIFDKKLTERLKHIFDKERR